MSLKYSKHRILSQAGDSIVEVLIAITVIAFVLAGAYASVSRNTMVNLDTQERGYALKLAEGQIEFLRGLSGPLSASNVCFAPNESTSPVYTIGTQLKEANCTYKPADGAAEYNIRVTPVSVGSSTYKISVVWDNATGSQSIVELYYRQYRVGA